MGYGYRNTFAEFIDDPFAGIYDDNSIMDSRPVRTHKRKSKKTRTASRRKSTRRKHKRVKTRRVKRRTKKKLKFGSKAYRKKYLGHK